MPIALGVLIWKKFGDSLYWQFMLALILLSYGAFLTYLLFPAAPPWMASQLGYFDPIHRISSDIWWAMGIKDFSSFYAKLSPNTVAAVPSLHSAYPALFALFLNRMYGFKKTWWVWLYPASLWLGVVYLGEHYIIDVILGVLYAVLAFVAADRFFAWQGARNWPVKKWWSGKIALPVASGYKKLKKGLKKHR
jgi:membrane-associated phospholipid phosphatase